MKTIIFKGDFVRKEGVAGGAITPGHLVKNFASNIVVHAAAGGNTRKAFALENDLVGDGIDTAYASDDTVQIGIPGRGAEVYAWLKNAENVAAGDPLESAGDGSLQAHTAIGSGVQVDAIVAYAAEALNNASGAKARIKVEVA